MGLEDSVIRCIYMVAAFRPCGSFWYSRVLRVEIELPQRQVRSIYRKIVSEGVKI